MRWTKTPPTEPGQYKVRRTCWGGRTATEVVLVYEDVGGLWVVEHGRPSFPDINQPMDEWLKEQPPTRWLGPIAAHGAKKEEGARV